MPDQSREPSAAHPGFPSPLGVSQEGEIYNFSLCSTVASRVTLALFDQSQKLIGEFPLHKTGSTWHIALTNIHGGDLYAYKIDDSSSWLADPYAKSFLSEGTWGTSPPPHLGRISAAPPFDWEGDTQLQLPLDSLIIYEMHIRGFSNDPSSGVVHPGTFLGVVEKIPHLQGLGVNAVELLPIFLFDETAHPMQGLRNYWGYSPLHFFAPMTKFASDPRNGGAECKEMVKALHQAGIEVILDVVYNHTDSHSSLRGIDKQAYYLVSENGEDMNFSGCGNTINSNHPAVIDLIVSSLRHWVTEYHVDGFRFDLASIFCRGGKGEVIDSPPLIEAICNDPILAKTKLIAEPWDCGGLYQVGSFPRGDRFAQWNGQFRDQVRRFLKGSDGQAKGFAEAIAGYPHLFEGLPPSHSINFVTAHDGFTLGDLVSYNEKHNEANGEENRDGNSWNESWNCGAEGATDDLNILSLRERQIRNFMCALLLSKGTPMILMGDEYGHSRKGNNNAYCQDNRLNYFLWDELESHQELYRFYRELVDFRKKHAYFHRKTPPNPEELIWHGLEPLQPNWERENRFVAFSLKDAESGDVYIAFNAHHYPVTLTLPQPPERYGWKRIVDTSVPSPGDFSTSPLTPIQNFNVPEYSCLVAKLDSL